MRLTTPLTPARPARFLRAQVVKPLEKATLLIARDIPESDILQVIASNDKNHPILSGCFDGQKRVRTDVYSIVRVRNDAQPLALTNTAADFVPLGWAIPATDTVSRNAEHSTDDLSAIATGLLQDAVIGMENDEPEVGSGRVDADGHNDSSATSTVQSK